MTTPQPGQPALMPDGNQPLKRRGLFAAAWAAVVGFVIARTSAPVEAAQVSLIYENAPSGAPLNAPSATVLIINKGDFNLSAGTSLLEVDSIGTPTGLTAIFGSSQDSNGVLGITKSGTGVFGQVRSTSNANAIAVYGQNYSTYAGPSPGAGGFAVYGLSARGHGLVGATAAAGAAAVVGATNGVAGAYAAAFYGPVIVGGAFTVVGGPKSAAVPHPDGSHRRMYCMESPESWFEDFGKGQLECGQASVQIDPDFAAVVDLEDYQVFLTEVRTTQQSLCRRSNVDRVPSAGQGRRREWAIRVACRRETERHQRRTARGSDDSARADTAAAGAGHTCADAT